MSAGRAVTFWILWLIVTQVGATVGYGLSLIAAITLLDSKTNQELPLLMFLVAMFFVPMGGLQWLVSRGSTKRVSFGTLPPPNGFSARSNGSSSFAISTSI